MKHILIPIDLSENCELAVQTAMQQATPDTTLHLLHVVDAVVPMAPAYVPGVDFGTVSQQLHDAGREHLETAAQMVAHAGLAFERTLVHGTPANEILLRAKEIQADLIVMATHGRKGLERLLLGSTAETVMRQAECPVMTVRPPGDEQPQAAPDVASNKR